LAVGTITTGVAAVAYGVGVERRRWTLRTATLPVLAEGARPLRVLHLSDLHLTPGQESKKRWVAALAELEPDLVVNTGDNLAHPRAVPGVLAALDPLLSRPGVFVFGSNDYFGPRPKNPARYLVKSQRRIEGEPLPWRDLRAAMTERGWSDVTHTRVRLEVDGMAVAVAGVDDPHLGLDRYDRIAGPPFGQPGLSLGLTHSPEPHVLDRFAADGYDLVLAGHTHGGQIRVPFGPAIVTNCGIDVHRARWLHQWDERMWFNVCAGLGTNPFMPIRIGCRPEAVLLTLLPRDVARG
jgi:predicted MPP superfamily phosphohydrolase